MEHDKELFELFLDCAIERLRVQLLPEYFEANEEDIENFITDFIDAVRDDAKDSLE